MGKRWKFSKKDLREDQETFIRNVGLPSSWDFEENLTAVAKKYATQIIKDAMQAASEWHVSTLDQMLLDAYPGKADVGIDILVADNINARFSLRELILYSIEGLEDSDGQPVTLSAYAASLRALADRLEKSPRKKGTRA